MTAAHSAHDRQHDHEHEHGHGHGHAGGTFNEKEAKQARRLMMVLVLIAAFFAVELAGALAAHSVVLVADALHLLMDVFALAMSLLAMRLAIRRPTARFTYGMRRAEPVAAIFNAMLVLGATAQIVHTGIGELYEGAAPQATIMLIVASAAIIVNGLSAWLLHGAIHHAHPHDGHAHENHGKGKKAHGHALNLRGAWLHLLGDTLGSLAALVAAIAIRAGGPTSIDPIASFVVAFILLLGAGRLVRDATLVLLEAAPTHLPVGAVREVILAYPGISAVHDLHVWTLGAGHDAITAHVRATSREPLLATKLAERLRRAFEVEYVTVQVESVEDPACEAPPSRFETVKH
jgi:cation diffusion facilitator family transporter